MQRASMSAAERMPKGDGVAWHSLVSEDAMSRIVAQPEGLAGSEAARRQAAYGPNRLPEARTGGDYRDAWRRVRTRPKSWWVRPTQDPRQLCDVLIVFRAGVSIWSDILRGDAVRPVQEQSAMPRAWLARLRRLARGRVHEMRRQVPPERDMQPALHSLAAQRGREYHQRFSHRGSK